MKYFLLSFLLLGCAILTTGQTRNRADSVMITTEKKITQVITADKGELQVNLAPADLQKFKSRGWVSYKDLGAKADGKIDDIDAIAAAHAVANQYGLTVKADKGASYYISGKERTAIIRTNTDFGTANFIIDDTEVQNHDAPVFIVSSALESVKLTSMASLKRNQAKIDQNFAAPSLITVTDSHVKRYIRYGLNQNNGSSQTDIFVVDKNGNVDMNAPIIWDFDQITEATALPIDEQTLTITGGRFTTIANKAESKYTYYSRNIAIRRSHVVVDGMQHRVTGEGDHGAPYGGFLNIGDCAYVTVKNTVLTGHKTYVTIGTANKPVSMGTYDLSVNRALNVSFINCSQTNDINDKTWWGILGSNFCKNLLYDSCTFSRFDAHMGVANATIRNSHLGYMGVNAIGSGLLKIENSTISGSSFLMLRTDYGSTWQGEVLIRNCVFDPAAGKPVTGVLIAGANNSQHDFGYTCYMPEKITIENLRINDAAHPDPYPGPYIFGNFNPENKDSSYHEIFPFVRTKEVILRNVTTASGKQLVLSANPYLFKDVKITEQ